MGDDRSTFGTVISIYVEFKNALKLKKCIFVLKYEFIVDSEWEGRIDSNTANVWK